MTEKPRTKEETIAAIERAARALRHQEMLLGGASFALGLAYVVFMIGWGTVRLREFASPTTVTSQWIIVGWYLVLFTMIYHLIHFPISYLRGYVVERRFRLSEQRFRRWLWAEAKRYFVSTVMVVVIGEIVYYILRRHEATWWLWAWAVYVVFGLVISRFGARVILPLFYKRAPIEDEALRERIRALVRIAGFKVRSVERLIVEKDTRRANAAVTGFGRAKDILVSDTLLAALTPEEIEGVVAHELAHIKRRHTEALFAIGTAVSFIGFVLAAGILKIAVDALGLGTAAAAAGFPAISDVAGFPVIVAVFAGLFLVLTPWLNYLSRKMERAADLAAADLVGGGETLASALEKIAATNLAERDQPRLYEIIFSSHPSTGKRVEYLRAGVRPKP